MTERTLRQPEHPQKDAGVPVVVPKPITSNIAACGHFIKLNLQVTATKVSFVPGRRDPDLQIYRPARRQSHQIALFSSLRRLRPHIKCTTAKSGACFSELHEKTRGLKPDQNASWLTGKPVCKSRTAFVSVPEWIAGSWSNQGYVSGRAVCSIRRAHIRS